jgi:serine/threonine protein kinase
MELCSQSLSETIKMRKKKNDFFTTEEIREFLAEMIPLFAKMQKQGYMHRDIKPDNILLSKLKKNSYRVADFGYAIKLSPYSSQNIAGTMEYVSPKLVAKFKDNKIVVPGHNFKDDVYSFGKTLVEMMTLDGSNLLVSRKIKNCLPRYGPDYHHILNLLLKEDENQRPDFIELEAYMIKRNLIASN